MPIMLTTKTKIIATIGPRTNAYEDIKDLHSAGMNAARINMSHASHSDAITIIESIHRLNKKQSDLFGPIGIILDTQGPEIRTGINKSDIDLQTGDIVNLTIRDDVDVETSSIKINYKGLIKSVEKGSKISIDNGLLNFQVLGKDQENLKCKVLDGGTLGSKRHVNLPGVRIDLPSITKKDLKDINFGIKHNVSFIALSFVRSAKEMLSGETSIGKYPVQCIKMIKKIASKTENFRTLGYEKFLQDNSDWQNIAKGARDLAARINADAIVIITRSGQTANVVSNTKPFRMPIYAFTNNRDTFHQLSLIGGIQPQFIKSITNQSSTISKIKSILNIEMKAKKSLKFVLIAGIYSASHTDSIQIIST